MSHRSNPAVAANGVTAKDYANAVAEAMRTGGASNKEAEKGGSKAHRSAVAGGAKRK